MKECLQTYYTYPSYLQAAKATACGGLPNHGAEVQIKHKVAEVDIRLLTCCASRLFLHAAKATACGGLPNHGAEVQIKHTVGRGGYSLTCLLRKLIIPACRESSRLASESRTTALKRCGCAIHPLHSKKQTARLSRLFFGGQRWIRTTEDRVGRFTVCSL